MLFVVDDRGQLRPYGADRIAGVFVTREPCRPGSESSSDRVAGVEKPN